MATRYKIATQDRAETLSNKTINEAKGSDIASATTTDIGAATGNYVNVTGTTTITGLGTVQAGTRRIVNFTGALTLTHNATSLILPTAANITTAAGDTAVFVSLGSGNWKCVSYDRASGAALAAAGGGSSDFLRAYVSSTQTISASTNTVVDYDTETYDTGGNFNTTTNTYTCPSAGKYYVYAVAQISNTFANSTRYDLEVQKNSTTIAEIFYQTSGTGGVLKKSMQISSIVDCALNDTLRINANFGSGNDIEAGSGLSWLEIYKIA